MVKCSTKSCCILNPRSLYNLKSTWSRLIMSLIVVFWSTWSGKVLVLSSWSDSAYVIIVFSDRRSWSSLKVCKFKKKNQPLNLLKKGLPSTYDKIKIKHPKGKKWFLRGIAISFKEALVLLVSTKKLEGKSALLTAVTPSWRMVRKRYCIWTRIF